MLFSLPMDQKLNADDIVVVYGDDDDLTAFRFVRPSVYEMQEKTGDSLNSSSMKEPRQLPKKYKLLSELFYSMLRSMLRLDYQKQLPIFHNICVHVKLLIGREFSYRDLAQIKSILPGAVQTDKIFLKNPKNLFMDPHLKVTLLFDVVAGHTEFSDTVALSKEFDSRLFQLVDTHGEDYDVPEAELPYPFNTRQIRGSSMNYSVDSSKNKLLHNHQFQNGYKTDGVSFYIRPFQMEDTEFEEMDFSPSSDLVGEITPASSFCAKVCDAPMPELPKLFNRRKTTVSSNLLPVDSSRKQFLGKDGEYAKIELSASLVIPSSLESADTTVDKETGFSTCADQTEHERSFQVSNGGTLMKNLFMLAQKNVESSIQSIPRR